MKDTIIETFNALRPQPSQLGQDISQAFSILASSTTLPLGVSNTYGHPMPPNSGHTHRPLPSTCQPDQSPTATATIQMAPTLDIPPQQAPTNSIPNAIARHIDLNLAANQATLPNSTTEPDSTEAGTPRDQAQSAPQEEHKQTTPHADAISTTSDEGTSASINSPTGDIQLNPAQSSEVAHIYTHPCQ